MGVSEDKIWVGWICSIGVWERGEEGTSLFLTGCVGVGDRMGCSSGGCCLVK